MCLDITGERTGERRGGFDLAQLRAPAFAVQWADAHRRARRWV